jgi:hypothetical protein
VSQVAAAPSREGTPTVVSVTSGPLAAPILRRVVGIFAARAQLPLDRLDEAILLVEALADHAGPLTLDGRVTLALGGSSGTLLIDLGPLRAGCAAQLVETGALPGLGNLIERLADELGVESVTDGELLRLRLSARA